MMWVANSLGDHQLLGESADDALGEAMDKAGAMVGAEPLPEESMGAALGRLALSISKPTFAFSVPMAHHATKLSEFSFSGLKTTLRSKTEGLKLQMMIENGAELSSQQKAELARAFLEAALAHLETRVKRVLTWARVFRPELRDLVICGGCAASNYICERIRREATRLHFTPVVPPPRLCTDNGVMIADLGLRRLQVPGQESASLEIAYHTQWPVGPRIPDFDRQVIASKRVKLKPAYRKLL